MIVLPKVYLFYEEKISIKVISERFENINASLYINFIENYASQILPLQNVVFQRRKSERERTIKMSKRVKSDHLNISKFLNQHFNQMVDY